MKPCLFFIPSIRSIRKNRRHCTLVSCVLIIGSLLSSIVLAGTTETNYQYDDLGRVKTVEYVNTASHTYTYDAADNRTGKQVAITPDTTPPSQPGTILFSNITATSATATWAAATDDRGAIDSYEYSYNNADPWVSVGAALTVTLTGRAPNTTYNLYVRAKDAAKNPGLSRSGNFKTLTDTLPPIISGVLSCPSVTSTSLTVTWWAASDNVAVTDYEYSYNNKINWFSAGLVTTKTISGLAPSTLYTVYVHAKDAAGNVSSDISGMCTTTGDTTRPGQPGTPEISNFTNTSVTATWTAATDDVGVTGYEYKLNENGSWVPVGLALTANLSGLTANTPYTVYVRARDAASNYTLIPPSKPFTTLNLIGAPGAPSFSGIGVNSVIASWAAATGNVASYEYSTNSGSTWTNVGNTLTATISSLSAGSTYSVLIRGRNTSGVAGSASSPNSVTTLNGNPGTPVASNITTTTATLTWTASSGTVASYQYSINSGATWTNVGNVLTVNLTGLTAGVTYTFHLQPKNTAGVVGPAAQPKDFTTLASLGAPTSLTSSNITGTAATLSWQAASGPVDRYEFTKVGESSWVNLGKVLSTSIATLSPGTTYTFLVRAKDASGNPGPDAPINVTTLNGNPGTPVASNLTTTTATLTWTASSGTVSSYQYSINGGTTWTNVGNVLSVNLTGLTSGTTYAFYLQPKNTVGAVGPVAQPVNFTTVSIDTQPPTQPGSVYVPDMSYPTAPVTWGVSTDNIGVVSYEYSLNGGTSWTNVGNVNSTTLTGLAAGNNYAFYVRARDAAGNVSLYANKSFTTIDWIVPTAPEPANVPDLSYPTASATWGVSTDNIGVVSYEYSLNGGTSWTNVGKVNSTTLTGLAAGNNYAFYVRAKDAAGNVSLSAQKSFTTIDWIVPSTPGVPVISNLTMTSFSVSWSASTDNIGVQSYWYSLDGGVTNINVGLSLSANISGLTPNRYQTIYVFAKDAAGNPSVASSKGFKTYPYPPTSAFVDGITATTATAHWSYPADAQYSGYEYSLDGSNWIFVGSDTNQVALSGLAASTTYIFRVRTLDLEGQRSSESTYQFTTSAPVVTVSISNVNVTKTTSGVARYSLVSDGGISVSYPNTNATYLYGVWLTPQTGMSQYEARATSTGGPFCGGTMGSWINLGSGANWTNTAQYSGYSTPCIFTLEIRKASNPSVILSSASITLIGKY